MKEFDLEKDAVKSKLGVRACVVLAGGFLMHVALGQSYSIGNFAPYFISYIRNRTDDTDTANIDVLWAGAIIGATDWIGIIIGGLLERWIGLKATVLIGSVLFSGSLAVTYFCVQVSYVAFLTTYSLLNSMSILLIYGITIQTAIRWIPNRTSLAAGIVLSGFGGGAFVFNQIITQFINPDNLSPDLETEDGEKYFTDPDMLDRVPYCFLILGGISFGMTFVGSLAMSSPPSTTIAENVIDIKRYDSEDTMEVSTVSSDVPFANLPNKDELNPNDNDGQAKSSVVEDKTNPSAEVTGQEIDRSIKQTIVMVLRTRSFYVIAGHLLCTLWAFSYFGSLYKAYGQTFIDDDHFLALIATLGSIFNSVGRPCWGLVMDRFGYRVTVRCMSLGMTILAATVFVTENLHKAFFMIWICLLYFCYCGSWAVCPSAVAKLFGARSVAFNYGFILPSAGISGIAVLVTAETLKSVIGWHGMFFMSAGLAFIPFLLTFAFNGVDTHGNRI